MDEDKIILAYHGHWDGSVYKNGEEVLVFMSLQKISFVEFLDDVHRIVRADRRICDYVLHCLITIEDCGVVKSQIRSTRDLHRVAKIFKTPKIFVTIKPKQHHGMDAPFFHGSQSFSQPNIHNLRQDSFVHLMASQGAYGNPFACDGPIPLGYNFPTGYEINSVHYPVMYSSAPYIHGARPSAAPYLSAPYGARPNPAPVVSQPRPNSVPLVNQPRPNSAPVVNQPRPNSALVVNQPRPNSAPVANQPTPSSAPVADQPSIPNRAIEMDQPLTPSTKAGGGCIGGHNCDDDELDERRTDGSEDDADTIDDDDDDEDDDDDDDSEEELAPDNYFLKPPINPRQAGQPKTQRVPPAGEACSPRSQPMCTRCFQRGHYRITCPANLPLTPAAAPNIASTSNKVT